MKKMSDEEYARKLTEQVIAQGADRQQVRRDIIEAIQVLFDVDMNRISIIKMKTNNQ